MVVSRRSFLAGAGSLALSHRAFAAPLNVRDFGIRGDGLTDETDGWRALARHVRQSPGAAVRGNRGDVYRLDGDTTVELPDACRLELDGARFLRLKPLPRGRYLITFGTDASVDVLDIEVGDGADFNRLVRFYDRAQVEFIDLQATRRIKNKASDLDAAVLFVGNQNRSTPADDRAGQFRLGRIHSNNIDAVVLFTQFSVTAGQPNPLRDISVGTCRFQKAVLGLYLRNVQSGTIEDVRQDGFADGAKPAEVGGNAVLCNGAKDIIFRRIEANDTPSHGMRIGGPVKNTFELDSGNITVEHFISRRSRRSGFKCKPGLDGSRARNITLKHAEIHDCHFGNAPSTNEQGVLLECTDDFQGGHISVGVRELRDGTSSHDAVHLSNVSRASFGRLDSDRPARHHVWLNSTPQANFSRGPLHDIRFDVINGRGAGGANIGVDGYDQEVSDISVATARFQGGKGPIDVRSGRLAGPIRIGHASAGGRPTCGPSVDGRLVSVDATTC
ncbi:MAG: hypothetical protein J0J10_00150 [Bosea sp.]|uniref:hypothetical protein n=1 Tax=Bosea sp. (in: a-proteobacteria) TaxID=1871050 RepID=UPI001AC0CA96|nr:hypothetical protein [Bosea sp. (in: a-proteobacteria)]MBN9467165.1 hypothetical protein [Bosea sp. (in: a-proteobacteria)]